MRGLLAAAAWAAAASTHAACPPAPEDGAALAAGAVRLAWRAETAPIVQGRPFALLLKLCPEQAVLTAVDATMPEHRHGMNYRPSVVPLGGGRWRVDGLLWHMSGLWALRFEIRHEGHAQVLRQDVVLP